MEAAPGYVEGGPRQSLEGYLSRDVAIVLGSEDRDGAGLLLEVNPAARRRARTGSSVASTMTGMSEARQCGRIDDHAPADPSDRSRPRG